MTEQFEIKFNNKHYNTINEFKKAIIDIEGGYYGHLGDYVVEAIEFYMGMMKNFPEKIGKERETKCNLTKTQQRINKFLKFGGDTFKPIGRKGMDLLVFNKILKSCFQKSEKTLREYRNDILNGCMWSIINIPKTRKKLVIHRDSPIYELIKRFDETKGNYYSGLKPNSVEKKTFQQLQKGILPQTQPINDYMAEGEDILRRMK